MSQADHKPSITELQRLREAMTAGEWEAYGPAVIAVDSDHPTYDTRVMLAGSANAETERAAINRRDAVANATGTAALVNAAPVLLEITAAALAVEDARAAAYANTASIDKIKQVEAHERLCAAIARYRDAISQVCP